MFSAKQILLSVCAALVLLPQTASGIITNGDFESGNVGFVTDYTFSPGNLIPEQTYDVLADPQDANASAASFGDHTIIWEGIIPGPGLMLAVNGATESGLVVWSQTVGVLPNVPYTFLMFTASWDPTPPYNTAELEIRINDAVVDVANAPEAVGTWEEFSTPWYSGISTTATIEIINLETSPNGNDFAIDDIALATPGDVNGNGLVDGTDLTIVISNWGMTGATRSQGDLSRNGTVDGPDYSEVVTYWGAGTPPEPTTIPEPATLGLMLVGGLAILRRPSRS